MAALSIPMTAVQQQVTALILKSVETVSLFKTSLAEYFPGIAFGPDKEAHHMIIPLNKNFVLPEMRDMRKGTNNAGKVFYLVTNEGVEASHEKAPTQTTETLRQHCCCCCN